MDLHYSAGARGARSTIVCRGSFENIPYCPQHARCNAVNDSSRGLPQRITKQSKGCQTASLPGSAV